MRKPHYPYLAEEIAWGVQNNLFNDPHGRAMIKLWKLGLCDDVIIGMIRYRIHKHQMQELFSDHPFKIPPGGEL